MTDIVAHRDLGDGRCLWVYRQIFNYRLVIGPCKAPYYDDGW